MQRVEALLLMSSLPIALAKLSVLYLYHRLFGRNRRFRQAIVVVGILCIILLIATIVGGLLRCTPIRKGWDPLSPGHCLKFQNFIVAIEVPSSFLDFVIVGLPIGVIKELHLPLKHRVALGFIFIWGAL